MFMRLDTGTIRRSGARGARALRLALLAVGAADERVRDSRRAEFSKSACVVSFSDCC